MSDALNVYFDGEKHAGLLLAVFAVAVLVAAATVFRGGPALRSFAVTLGIVALAEIALGVGLYARTGPQVRRLTEQLDSDPEAFYSAEAPRMSRVQRNFVVIEYIELLIVVGSAITAISSKARPGLTGVALGLLISASVLLAFDLFAERRGAEYLLSIASRGHSG
jgi:hypothetical protein